MAPSFSSPTTTFSFTLEPGKQGQITTVSEIIEDEDDTLTVEKRRLCRHLGLEDETGHPPTNPLQIQPLFFIEKTPDSRGPPCNLPGCNRRIEPGDLRLALNPAMESNHWFRASSDFYHIRCFEKIADFSQADFLDRVQPLTRNTWELRGLKASSVRDGSYIVPGGVERLILEWKVTRGMWIDKRDGVYDERAYYIDEGFDDLLHKAGSSTYIPRGRPAGLDLYEHYALSQLLAPNESDGPQDQQEWNLFAHYLDFTVKTLSNPHELSMMLQRWEDDVTLAWREDRDAKNALAQKATRALKRLSAIPIPQAGSNRLGYY
ncbi:hypothetical protein AOCH_005601 [Aspergillus ochraceoroseus]|uniref:Uncharacterized protein n=1 Tax=Aspergillus ochraceoroseus TaxID=138278 RepID=A0A0F8UW76_9EURO|nr:hypothetical protein AOCH_005601 [Aspergillus ochraceoroseus]